MKIKTLAQSKASNAVFLHTYIVNTILIQNLKEKFFRRKELNFLRILEFNYAFE